MIGAHFDHLGYGNSSSLSTTKEIHNGADDNASGVALMIDLAKKLSPYGPYSNELNENNYLFIAFGAEELGLLGSNYFNKYPTLELESINYMFNFDMVGVIWGEITSISPPALKIFFILLVATTPPPKTSHFFSFKFKFKLSIYIIIE